MTERRFTLDDEENGLCRCILVDGEEMPTCEICELLNEEEAIIQRLKLENENLRKQVKSFETTMNATSDYNAFLESKITTLEKENKQLKKSEKINMEYAEQIVEENQKLRITKNDLRIKNEQLKQKVDFYKYFQKDARELEKKNEQLKQTLENIGLHEKNNSVKMIEGKFFIRM